MSQITILLLYLLAAIAFAMSRLPQHAARSQLLLAAAFASALVGLGQAAFDLGLAYAKERTQFGVAIGSSGIELDCRQSAGSGGHSH